MCTANTREKKVATTIKIHYHFTARVDFFRRLLAVKVSRVQRFYLLIQISHVDILLLCWSGWHTSLAFAHTSNRFTASPTQKRCRKQQFPSQFSTCQRTASKRHQINHSSRIDRLNGARLVIDPISNLSAILTPLKIARCGRLKCLHFQLSTLSLSSLTCHQSNRIGWKWKAQIPDSKRHRFRCDWR